MPVLDWLRVFWTLKDSFAKTFVESFKTLLTAARSCGSDYQHRLGQLVYVLELRTANVAGLYSALKLSRLYAYVIRAAPLSIILSACVGPETGPFYFMTTLATVVQLHMHRGLEVQPH